jgi:hypothetical protein
LVRRGAQDVAKPQLFCARDNAAGVGPAAAQIAIGHAQMTEIVGTQRRKPRDFGTLNVGTSDRNNAHQNLLMGKVNEWYMN